MKYYFGAEVSGGIMYTEKVIHVFVTKGALKRWLKEDPVNRMPAVGDVIERMLSVMDEPLRFLPDPDTAIISRYVRFCDRKGWYDGYSPIVGEVVPSWYIGSNVLMEQA